MWKRLEFWREFSFFCFRSVTGMIVGIVSSVLFCTVGRSGKLGGRVYGFFFVFRGVGV